MKVQASCSVPMWTVYTSAGFWVKMISASLCERSKDLQVKVITQFVLVHFSIQPCFHGKRTPSIPQRFSGFKDLRIGVVGICVSVLWSMTATPSMATATEMTLLPPLIRLSSRASRPCQLSLFIWWHSIYIISNQLHVLSLSLSLSLSPSLSLVAFVAGCKRSYW